MDKAFVRTQSGLDNEHLFHGVDYTVYLEGGSKSYKLEEVISDENNYSKSTLDIAFWSNIFQRYYPDIKVKFKSIGSKVVILDLADIIIDQNTSHVLLCMDNEFDELLNQRKSDKRILYTYGYSWENEIWSTSTVNAVVKTITCLEPNRNTIEHRYNSFLKDIKNAVFADYFMFSQGASFLPRSKGVLKYIDLSTIECCVKTEDIDKDICSTGIDCKILESINFDIQKFCYGHLLANYCCSMVRLHLKSELEIECPPNDTCNRIAITEHFRNDYSETIQEHYSRQFERLK